jgi:hypothetical protein
VTDDDVFVRRHRDQNINLKTHSVSVVVTRSDYRDPTGGDVMIARFKPLEFASNGYVNLVG